ncbi:MAG: AAA family ATPase [Cyanobacteriota bacterium]|nr:AAA family ATPase [Cyanobacteriota bacterium]
MSTLAPALLETLQRLLPPRPGAGDQPLLEALVEALLRALDSGELGLDLAAPAPEGLEPQHWPQGYLRAVQASGWLLQAEAVAASSVAAPQEAPIVQDGTWLRWRRWHQLLLHCIEQLLALAAAPVEPAVADANIQRACAAAEAAGLDGCQSAAVAALLRHRMVLLRGGPGTGKTSTVVQMLAAALQQQAGLRVHLAAPTGKAAARLAAAVAAGHGPTLPCTTLHRLLEARGGDRFGRHAQRPLELDLLVVDELSMVDLPLLAALLQALPPQARLLLVGDAAQLPPVGTGAVLEELCRPARLQALGAAAVELRTTYRNNGAIAALASSLRQAPSLSGPDPLQPLRGQLEQLRSDDNVQWWPSDPSRLPEPLLARLRRQQHELGQLAAALSWPADAEALDAAACQALLQTLERCIALTPVRQGRWGVEALHRSLLGETNGVLLQRWPLGTPVLNRVNRPEQGLANGDIGVLVQRGTERWVLLNGPRLVHPARIGGAEPALALTVHKAQGSQYNEVLLLLPPMRRWDSRLLYTGLTRAQQRAVLITPA